MASFPVKLTADHRAMLNLACGTRMHREWNNLDFSPYARLARRPVLAWMLKTSGFLSPERRGRLDEVDPEIISWDLRKGIPFPSETFDVVYHSHFLEHIDRENALGLLQQCHRVLKTGGILRVVVPDLEWLVNEYVSSLQHRKQKNDTAIDEHQNAIAALFDQMVRREPSGTIQQRPAVRFVERLIRGDAERAGELHRWMYDQFSLRDLLYKGGFGSIQRHFANSSSIPGWSGFYLDNNTDGSAYKPESLYMEGVK
jgi:SAM-dependent methyltransferase